MGGLPAREIAHILWFLLICIRSHVVDWVLVMLGTIGLLDRFARPLKNCTRSDRGLMPAFGTDQKRTFGFPRLIAMAARTHKTLGPTQTQYIIITILLCCESCYKLFKIFRVILMLHNLSSISKCMAGILHVVVTGAGGKRIPSCDKMGMHPEDARTSSHTQPACSFLKAMPLGSAIAADPGSVKVT